LINDNIIAMAAAKVAPSVIISQIRSSKTNFDLSAFEVIRLSKAGVPAPVIEAMRGSPGPALPAPVAASSPAVSTPDAARVPSAAIESFVLGDGSPVSLALAAPVPNDAKEGDPLQFQVATDVRVNDTVVIAKGAAATGAIVDAAKKKILGIGGKMTFRLVTVEAVDGEKVAIRVTPAARSDGPPKRTLDPGVGRSKDGAGAAGTVYTGYIDGARTISVKR
jgi:hypothetical protein